MSRLIPARPFLFFLARDKYCSRMIGEYTTAVKILHQNTFLWKVVVSPNYVHALQPRKPCSSLTPPWESQMTRRQTSARRYISEVRTFHSHYCENLDANKPARRFRELSVSSCFTKLLSCYPVISQMAIIISLENYIIFMHIIHATWRPKWGKNLSIYIELKVTLSSRIYLHLPTWKTEQNARWNSVRILDGSEIQTWCLPNYKLLCTISYRTWRCRQRFLMLTVLSDVSHCYY
jgi:hypothetical protein